MQTDNQNKQSGSAGRGAAAPASVFLSTEKGKTKSNAIEIPSVSLPKGGGALKGIDEKFSVNAVNGTASFSIPLPFSPARGAVPALSLSYNSGNGNTVFGLGWNLNLPSIKRKTDKGLPQYFDNNESDIFLFSESEDLVPEYKKDNGQFIKQDGAYVIFEKNYPEQAPFSQKIRYYKPRTEGLFARIERWTETATGIIKWRVITKDNITTLFGWTDTARIADPSAPSRIYEWLPEFIFDDKGNSCHYFYEAEVPDSVDRDALHDRNRIKNNQLTFTNRYLHRILYGNTIPYTAFGDPFTADDKFLFETVFDYGAPGDTPDIINKAQRRTDAFSDYKAGFEIRTTRLCRRVLFFHHFTEYDGLVKSMDFDHDSNTQAGFTFLKSITSYGYLKKTGGSYSQKSLPPVTFTYQPHDWNKDVKTISPENFTHMPSGLDEGQYQFTDLFNEGLSGMLTEQADGWYYKHNLGNGEFEKAKLVSPRPSFSGLGSQWHLADLDANGGKQLVNFATEPKGFFDLTDEEEWQPFKNFQGLLNINLHDANAKMLDLNGDGKAEVLVAEDNIFCWHESAGKKGFENTHYVVKPYDEETGPAIMFADDIQSIFLADMSGDGLSDIVRIRNGEVCYWPNMGYGKFGPKILMDNAPVFDFPDAYNPAFIRLADIDGSGTTDIIYLGKNKFSCWSNYNGNAFSKTPFETDAFPGIDNHTKITVTDLLGNGVACIVWSSPMVNDAYAPVRYIDLMNSKKPHIMTGYSNNMGKEVSMEYKPSTYFYLQDKKAGRPWITKLHFPVHCIARTVTTEKISGYSFESAYTYHHGYYDHVEREFRGFGMVEQTDCDKYGLRPKTGISNSTHPELDQPPVISRSWVHNGAFLNNGEVLNQFEKEYWFEEMKRQGYTVTHHEYRLPDAKIIDENGNAIEPGDMNAQDWQEALRICRGMALRTEIFSKETGKENLTAAELSEKIKKELTPYSVATHNCIIQRLQPRGNNKHAIFIVKESESISYSYERNTDDPRITHNLNIQFDDRGNILEAATVVYPRKPENIARFETAAGMLLPAATKKAQEMTCIMYTENKFTNDIDEENVYRLRLPSEVKTYQLKGVNKTGDYFLTSDFHAILNNADTALYHELDSMPTLIPEPTTPPLYKSPVYKPLKRLIEHIKTIYRNDNLTDPLPPGRLHSLGLSFESYQLAYTPGLLNDIYSQKIPAAATESIMTDGKFVHCEGDANWWIPSGKMNFIDAADHNANTAGKAKERFYLPISYTDPWGYVTKVAYETYRFFVQKTTDELLNETTITRFNYRTLSPQQMKDANDNLSEVITDELGLVKAMAVMGKDTNGTGIGGEADDLNLLTEITSDAEQLAIDAFFSKANEAGVCDSVNLHIQAKNLLHNATTRFLYDFAAYQTKQKPAVVVSIARETHYRDKNGNPVPEDSKLQLSFEYSNGLGKVIMNKMQAEPGDAKEVMINPDRSVTITLRHTGETTPKQLRWIGNGRTILNNKGNAVKQYEPFFSVSPKFEDEKELVETGITPVMYYDAMGKLIKTEMPDGTFSKVEFDAWQQKVFDANDTVTESDWYNTRINLPATDPENIAASKAAKHAGTPNRLHFDTLGRPVLSTEHNKHITTGADEFYNTIIELDIEGNLRNVTDARANSVMTYKYDMLGTKVYQQSMDAGQRWLMLNIAGNPLRTWDERDHEFQYEYDRLHRPTKSRVINTTGQAGDEILNNVFGRMVYGENQPGDKQKNLRGKPFRHYDTAGLLETPGYNFKGHPVSTARTLVKDYKHVVNWIDNNITPGALANLLEADTFTFITETDALGRITRQTAPDKSIITPAYNEAGLLNSETVEHFNPAATAAYIKDIDYNEKGLRNFIKYGNGIRTSYLYDEKTFRLQNLKTNKNNKTLQDLWYTYDPVGNILRIEDKANDTTFFNNMQVEPVTEYTYDALYRLTAATGRENNTAADFTKNDNWNDGSKMIPQHTPGDPMAVLRYTESYRYDEVGNIKEMNHQGSWKRTNEYETNSNRLKSSTVTGQTFLYPHHPQHGYITQLPHLAEMVWNYKEELVSTSQQAVSAGNGTPETTYYQYDGQGQRIRKVTENYSATTVTTKKDERIYIAGYETYRTYDANKINFERESLSLMDKEHRFVMIETVIAPFTPPAGEQVRMVRYQLHNHLGSACLETDEQAVVISYEEYHPWGTTAYQAKNASVKSAAKRYRYTGMERDDETGLSYHSARYYLPWLGRWLSTDPIGIGDGVNVYRYATCNPIKFCDSNGHQTVGTLYGIAESNVREADRIRDLLGQMSHNPEQFPSVTEGRKAEMRKQMNSLYKQAGKFEMKADIESDFHKNVGLPLVINIGGMVIAAPAGAAVAGTRLGTALTYYGVSKATLGVGETIVGKTVSLTPGSFGEVKDLKGSDRFWYGVQSGSELILSASYFHQNKNAGINKKLFSGKGGAAKGEPQVPAFRTFEEAEAHAKTLASFRGKAANGKRPLDPHVTRTLIIRNGKTVNEFYEVSEGIPGAKASAQSLGHTEQKALLGHNVAEEGDLVLIQSLGTYGTGKPSLQPCSNCDKLMMSIANEKNITILYDFSTRTSQYAGAKLYSPNIGVPETMNFSK